MNLIQRIDVEDVLGLAGVAAVAVGLSTFGIVWTLLFLGAVLIGLAGWMARTRRGRPRG